MYVDKKSVERVQVEDIFYHKKLVEAVGVEPLMPLWNL